MSDTEVAGAVAPTSDTPAEPAAEPSMDDTMAAVFDDIQAREDTDEAAAETPAPDGDAAPTPDPADGDTPEGEPAAEAEPSGDTTDGDTPEGEPVAPEYWSDETKAAFDALDDDGKAVVVEATKASQADYTRKTQEAAEIRKASEPLAEVVSKWDQYFQQMGTTPSIAINTLLQAEYILRTGTPEQKRNALASIQRDYGIAAEAPDDLDAYQDPELASVNEKIDALTQFVQSSAQATQQTQHQGIVNSVTAFMDAKDDAGKLLHPDFDKVEAMMAAMLRQGQIPNNDLEEAYKAAVYANPETREAALKAATTDASMADTKAKREAAARKAAGANVKASSQPGAEPAASGSWDDDDALGAIYDKAAGA